MALRSLLHARGLRFRKEFLIEVGGLRVRADVAFPARRLAVFVDGCFWHRCPLHGNAPRVNTGYWAPKLERNVARDRRVDAALVAAGWTSLRIWEHEPPEVAVDEVAEALQTLSGPSRG